MEENWTNVGPKNVPSSFASERVVRGFLADTLNFLRSPRKWPEVDGDLSDWVMKMHGLETGNPSVDSQGIEVQEVLKSLDSLCAGLQGLRHGSQIQRQLEKIGREEGPRIIEAQRSADKQAVDAVLSTAISKMMKAAGMPESFPTSIGVISYAGFVKLLRATRVMLVSTALFHEHPLSLIARASNGDRRATLNLIKVDHMFVNDRCCKEIRKAALQDDVDFMGQVQRALKYKRRIHRREILRFYLFTLFLFETFGIPLPPINDLWRRLDPLGSEYKTLQAFEKDVQRRRADFEQILEFGAQAAKSLAALQVDSAGTQEC